MAEPGEVLGAGGKVLALTDLSDVYMYVVSAGGHCREGGDGARSLALSSTPCPRIRSVASSPMCRPLRNLHRRQSRPAEERHNLSFRVKLQLDRERLRAYERLVKVGIPGMGYVRLDSNAQWPVALQPKPVETLPWNPTGTLESPRVPRSRKRSASSESPIQK